MLKDVTSHPAFKAPKAPKASTPLRLDWQREKERTRGSYAALWGGFRLQAYAVNCIVPEDRTRRVFVFGWNVMLDGDEADPILDSLAGGTLRGKRGDWQAGARIAEAHFVPAVKAYLAREQERLAQVEADIASFPAEA